MRLKTIGVDVKVSVFDRPSSADSDYWSRNENIFNEVLERISLKINFFELLDVDSELKILAANDLVNDICGVLVVLALYDEDVERVENYIGCEVRDLDLDNVNVECIGDDVCDLNGLFSCRGDVEISEVMKTVDNYSVSRNDYDIPGLADSKIPEHAPHFRVLLYKLGESFASRGER